MPVSATKGRSFRINQNPTKAKTHTVYSDAEVLELYDITRNTITNWVKDGLGPIPDLAPRLFLGSELNRYHNERRLAAKRKPQGDELYCIACRAPRSMSGRVLRFASISGVAGRLSWTCPTCDQDWDQPVGSLSIERLEANGIVILRSKEATE